ncbi:MAG: alpha,alpha-trehalase TreF [Ignavibacteria bacterium]|nr:alpha,alpha-trehalase TreF [Ignavibacteria bacterium]MCU7502830.1 alpha,alpha-trehalase TreF [Ignavibacteria bacterium]MCU7515676.1 alpha,alpha-trehalase TreF [Ignavibacteria bacterium]
MRALKKSYIQLSGELFRDVQTSGVFTDSKTFVDCLPRRNPALIRKEYDSVKVLPGFKLKEFVGENFFLPESRYDSIRLPKGQAMMPHIETLWGYLLRKPDTVGNSYSTLIPLKYSYVVPGGRFREVYYWDSYFTMLGLISGGHFQEAEDMVRNFAYLTQSLKMIPNGNRLYYVTRSQPPFFALMVDLISWYKKDYYWGLQFLDELLTEYRFWMHGLEELSNGKNRSLYRLVLMDDEAGVLNRYYDSDTIPREESYQADYKASLKIPDSLKGLFYRNIRAAAESGWDFSSRWFKDEKSLLAIQTTDILPVDLNCLLYFLEDRLGYLYELSGSLERSEFFKTKASKRFRLINKIFWNEEDGFYHDYNWKEGRQTKVTSLAGCFPLYFGIARPEYAERIAEKIRKEFLMPGGLVTTLKETGEQWDAPNGWAPLQWIAVKGLRQYGFDSLAEEIKTRWVNLNGSVYKRTGRMLEKYNVENLELFAGGGEYPLQDGFGWTNGIIEAFFNNLDEHFSVKILKNNY